MREILGKLDRMKGVLLLFKNMVNDERIDPNIREEYIEKMLCIYNMDAE